MFRVPSGFSCELHVPQIPPLALRLHRRMACWSRVLLRQHLVIPDCAPGSPSCIRLRGLRWAIRPSLLFLMSILSCKLQLTCNRAGAEAHPWIFLRKTALILFWKLAWIWRGFFEPFFPCPKKSAPNPRHPKSPNPRHFRKLFSQCFLWVLDPVCVAVFGCQYFYADQPRVVS